MKVREVKADELENDARRLEDYLCKTEARNVEFEASVRTLQRRISILECMKSDNKPSVPACENAQDPRTLKIPGPQSILQDQYCQHKAVPTVSMKSDLLGKMMSLCMDWSNK